MSDEWMATHKGDLLFRWGHVWECGDDECGCTEAQVVAYYQNKVIPVARVPIVEWSGEFRTEHEPGADLDLAEHRRALKQTDPELEASIKWQEGIDYAAH